MIEFFVNIDPSGITNRKAVAAAFNSLSIGRYRAVIKPYKARSNNQNAFYWGCLLPMFTEGLRDVGYSEIKTDMDAHRFIKREFLKKEVPNIITGQVITLEGSTAELTTTEFNDLIDRLIQHAAEYLNVQIPYPGESMEMKFD